MQNVYFASGTAKVGGKELAFDKRELRGGLRMYIPTDFVQERNIVSNYMYFFSQDKSPLGIAIKFSAASGPVERDKMVAHYFGQPAMEAVVTTAMDDYKLWYRETVTDSRFLSVYSLRFCREIEGGLLFGCFNCAAAYREDWKEPVLQMLFSVERTEI